MDWALLLAAVLLNAAPSRAAEVKSTSFQEFLIRNGYELVQLKMDDRNKLYVGGRIHQKSVKIMIDTGAMCSAVDPSIGSTLAPVGRMAGNVRGVFGVAVERPALVNLDKVELGASTISGMQAAVLPLRGPRRTATGSNISTADPHADTDMILGMDFLTAHHALLLVAGPKLYLRREKPDVALADAIGAALKANGWVDAPIEAPPGADHICVSGQINGHAARLLLDTGSFVTQLDWGQLAALGVKAHETLGNVSGVGSKQGALNFTKIDSFKVGAAAELIGVNVGIVDLASLNQGRIAAGQKPIQGILGPEYLDRWLALIDCATPRVFLKK